MGTADSSGRPALPITARILDDMVEAAVDLADDDLDAAVVAAVLSRGLLERGVDPVALAFAALELAVEYSPATMWRGINAARAERLAAQAEEVP